MAWAAVGVAVVGAVASADASQNAASAAEGANARQIAEQRTWNERTDPFSAGGNRAQYVPQLNELMAGGYAGLENDPMYQWMRDQGVDQVQRGMSKTGGLDSGAEAIALQKQGFGLSMDFFDKQYARLADLSGASRGGGAPAMGSMSAIQAGQVAAAPGQALAQGLGGIYGAWKGAQAPSGSNSYNNDPNNNMYNNGTYSGNNNLI